MKLSVLKLFFPAAGLLAVAYLGICAYLWQWQSRLIFFPSAQFSATPADLNLSYEEVWLPIANSTGDRLHGWWIPATGQARGTLLYLHGNGANIGANVWHAQRFQQMGFSVLLIDYRGYGQSSGGFPTEAQVYEDAETAWRYLTEVRRVPPPEIFVYGHSLGGAVAIDLALRHPDMAGLIVQGTFTAIRDMIDGSSYLRLFPVDRLLHQRFESIDKVPLLRVPILLIHGAADRTVPAQMSERLYAAAPDPKQLWLVPDAGHNNVADLAGEEYFRVVKQFVEQVRQR